MKFTFFKRQRVFLPISKIANREFNVLSRTELAKLQNFSLFFPGGRGPPWRNLNFWIFRKKQSAMDLFISIFENSSPKGSFRYNKINYEILQLSAESRYLQSGPLRIFVDFSWPSLLKPWQGRFPRYGIAFWQLYSIFV